jgi:hypothetical protein
VAGTTVTENVGNGTTTAFTFNGRTTDEGHAYLVSVGGIDQPPSKYTISNANNGTITFVDPPVNNELISIRAIVSSGGGGGSGDATSLQGVAISVTAPDSGQGLVYDGTEWAPAGIGNATKIQGRDIDDTAPTDGQILGWDNTASKWTPVAAGSGVDAASLQSYAISADGPAADEILTWAQVDGGGGDYEWRPKPLGGYGNTPTEGQTIVYNPNSGWAAGDIDAVKLTGTTVSTTAPTANQALVYDGEEWAPADVDAAKIQGETISTANPANGNLLRYDGTNWAPFNGYAIPNWVDSTPYVVGDIVWYNGKIWNCLSANQSFAPGPTSIGFWGEILGTNSGTPNNTSTPVAWLNVQTIVGQGWIPIYQ